MRFEVDPTSSTGYRLVPEDGQGQSSPAQVPAVGDLRGGVDVDGRTYIEVWGGAAWSRVSAVGGSTVVAPQGPTTDTQGFTFTQDAVPTTSRVGDTWFQSSTGLSFVWFDGRWVQFAPGGGGGGGTGYEGHWAIATGAPNQGIIANGVTTISWAEPYLGDLVYENPAVGTLAFVIPKKATYLVTFSLYANVSSVDRARMNIMGVATYDSPLIGGVGTLTVLRAFDAGDKLQFQTYNGGAAGAVTAARLEIREMGPADAGLPIGGGGGGGSAAAGPAVMASAWLTTTLDLPAQAPSLSVSTVMLQGHSTTDPTAVDYDPATGKFTVLKAGLYHVIGRAKVLASSDTFTLGANGYELTFDLRKASSNATIQTQAVMRLRNEAPPFVIQELLECQAYVRFAAGENLFARIRHGFPQLAGEPANAHGTGKTQLRIAYDPLGGHATAIDIVRIGD